MLFRSKNYGRKKIGKNGENFRSACVFGVVGVCLGEKQKMEKSWGRKEKMPKKWRGNCGKKMGERKKWGMGEGGRDHEKKANRKQKSGGSVMGRRRRKIK